MTPGAILVIFRIDGYVSSNRRRAVTVMMQETMMKNGLLALAACTLAIPVSAAATSNPFAQDATVLRLSGLDLATVEGQQRLAIRMDEAARAVCGERLANIHLSLDARTRACRTEVIADIRAEIDARTGLAAKTSKRQLASR